MSNDIAAVHAAGIVYATGHYATVDIYEALRAERSVKFLGYDLQTSHNTPLIMSAAMFTYECSVSQKNPP